MLSRFSRSVGVAAALWLIVGTLVLAASAGGINAGSVTVQGTVTSVNGGSAHGTCGAAGAAGSFTLSTKNGPVTVNVSTSTTFEDAADPSPSFADVCVGAQVDARGAASAGGINATSVTVQPSEAG